VPEIAATFEQQLERLEADKPVPPEILDHDARAHLGARDVTGWCPKCRERAVPMANGTCGWCDTVLYLDQGEAPAEPETRAFPEPAESPPAGRSHEQQRRDALERSKVVRAARADLKRRLRGAASPPEALEHAACIVRRREQPVTNLKVYDLLTSCPGMGSVRAGDLLRRLQITPTKRIGELTPRQLHHLEVALGEMARQRRSRSRAEQAVR
jgi:hypothetical protein